MTAYAEVTPGFPIPDVYRIENIDLVQDGCVNMAKHIQNAIKFGVPVVVAINRFAYGPLYLSLTIEPTQMLNSKRSALLLSKPALMQLFPRGTGAKVGKVPLN